MKKLMVCCALLLSIAARAQDPAPAHHKSVETPPPPYPAEARASRVVGAGACSVVFDGSGGATTAAMTPSTGSKILDNYTLKWAKSHWSGKPNTTVKIPILYVSTPVPPYPAQAFTDGVQGSGKCKVVFDGKGNVGMAIMTKSTGSKLLDENTLVFARANWLGPPNATAEIPVTYKLPPGYVPGLGARFFTPVPSYPEMAPWSHIAATGNVRVTFDAQGECGQG